MTRIAAQDDGVLADALGRLLLEEMQDLLGNIAKELQRGDEIRTERFRAHLAEMRADMAEFRADLATSLATLNRRRSGTRTYD